MISKMIDLAKEQPKNLSKLAVLTCVALGLSGCVGAENLAATSEANVDADTKVVTVNGQKLTLGRAADYCFNDRQSRFTATGAFVVLVPCDPLDEGSLAKGLILVNVLADQGMMDAINTRELEAYFQSDAGRTALSRRAKPESLTLLGTMQDDGVYYVHTTDADGPVIPDTTNDQWRAFMVVKDRLVSVSVVNFLDDKMTDGQVFAHMEAVALRIKSLN
ncbi:hypothetical protein [Amylibacter sp. IMCC11727]|uniref:hypothetical protein n=1 Tax=Amylibacter sp. IMCC11727 TaxID=3039851 RepID=UPI00244DDE83|nr:hypothetical protein [Amylibacter sp. IMCC11727]WGI22004.1 hypothetical protein QBD29_00890 [Amylibacter sp. IMCC11727]